MKAIHGVVEATGGGSRHRDESTTFPEGQVIVRAMRAHQVVELLY